MIIDGDGDGQQGDADDPRVVEHSREGSEDLASEARTLLDAVDRANASYSDEVKSSPAVARSTFAEEVGMGVNALRGKLEDRGEEDLAGELRWDLEAEDFDAEIQRVRSAVERVADGAAEPSDEGDAGEEAGEDGGDGDRATDDDRSEDSARSDDDDRDDHDEDTRDEHDGQGDDGEDARSDHGDGRDNDEHSDTAESGHRNANEDASSDEDSDGTESGQRDGEDASTDEDEKAEEKEKAAEDA